MYTATPGHDCPGLIEASGSWRPVAFRSLPTPGHDCPGLIEATRSAAGSATTGSPLRGMIAPASLKREDRDPADHVVDPDHSGA